MSDHNDIARLRRRYHAARQRALYWSGNMTFTGKRWKVNGPHAHQHEIMLELAMDDLATLSLAIERLTGRAPKPYDPKRIAAAQWARINEATQKEPARE